MASILLRKGESALVSLCARHGRKEGISSDDVVWTDHPEAVEVTVEALLDKADSSDMTNSSIIAVVRITLTKDTSIASVNLGPDRLTAVDTVWINRDPNTQPLRATVVC